jgi:Leucine-rich repeat (LRR) protein
MRLITFILLISTFCYASAFYCPSFLQNQTTCSCDEYIDGAIIKCHGKEGPLIVEQLKNQSAQVRELWLEHAKIIQVGPNAFKPLKLKKLVLDNNPIQDIDAHAFKGLESTLQDLSVSMTKLSDIPTDAIAGLRALNVLNLKCNNIGNLTDVAFHNTPSLIEVNLACNQICNIGAEVFKNVKNSLQNLVLDNNCFTKVPTEAINGMTNLIALHMKYNKLKKLGSHQITNVKSLSMLTFTHNEIETIEPDFVTKAANIRYIYLNENKIKNIVSGTFKQFNSSEVIDLSYNELTEITSNMFSGLESLQHLNLESNAIKEIAAGAFSTTPLLLLWLPHNCLTSVSPAMFQGTPFLKQISLANNNIRIITPLSFAHLANLHTLDLSSNKISSIETGALTGTDFMTVRLQENPFVCTQDGFHVLNGQEAINLTSEANLICQSENVHDNTDQCPRRKELPSPQPCCLRTIVKTTTMPQFTTTPEPETTPIASEINAARERARKLNMERFWRLSHPPADIMRPHADSTVKLSAPSNSDVDEAEEKPRHRTQSYRSQLLPYLRNNEKTKVSTVDFSEDDKPETVQA